MALRLDGISAVCWFLCWISVWAHKVVHADMEGCHFPVYLWSRLPDESRKYWTGKMDFPDESSIWQVKQDIQVEASKISIKELANTRCSWTERRGGVECFSPPSSFQITCLAQERHGNYRVYISRDKKTTFSCMKFVKRNDNVVQIYQAEESAINEDILCHDSNLRRDAWPWILEDLHSWIFCPNFGGFDFRAISSNGNEKCGDEWLPSRLESECVPGEGLIFYFPQPHCSPFQQQRSEFRMQCWGHWTEGDYQYILFSEKGQMPRYSLRFHKSAEKYDELSADLYLSAVVPDNTQVNQSAHWKLSLLRSDEGVCYDESERCREAARNGRCTPPAAFSHANQCRHSCGLCGLAPSAKSECKFHAHLQGVWLLFSETGGQEIAVSDDEVVFSQFGKYNCKSKHWNSYKVMSVYTNGCRPRYTCLKMKKEAGSTATVQFSRSSLEDKSFEMCQFEDDIVPLGSFIHSEVPKYMLPLTSMLLPSCNLGGQAPVRTSYMDGVQCEGSITDINRYTCEVTSSFSVTSQKACPHAHNYEYNCIANADLSNGRTLTVTEYAEPLTYVCWLKDTSISTHPVFTRVTCDTALSYENFTGSNSIHYVKEGISTISLTADAEKPCNSIQEDGPVDNKNYPTVPYVKSNSDHIQVSRIAIHPLSDGSPHDDTLGVTPPFRHSDTKSSAKDNLPTSYSNAQERGGLSMSNKLSFDGYCIIFATWYTIHNSL